MSTIVHKMSGTSQQRSVRHMSTCEPTMSDTTILIRLDELITMALGTKEKNVVNFKLVQTILYALTRQMRMLEQQVEVQIGEGYGRSEEWSSSEEDVDQDAKTHAKGKGARGARSAASIGSRTQSVRETDEDDDSSKKSKAKLKREKIQRQHTELEGKSRELGLADKRITEKRERKDDKSDRSIATFKGRDKPDSEGRSGKAVSEKKDHGKARHKLGAGRSRSDKDGLEEDWDKLRGQKRSEVRHGAEASDKEHGTTDKESKKSVNSRNESSRSRDKVDRESSEAARDGSDWSRQTVEQDGGRSKAGRKKPEVDLDRLERNKDKEDKDRSEIGPKKSKTGSERSVRGQDRSKDRLEKSKTSHLDHDDKSERERDEGQESSEEQKKQAKDHSGLERSRYETEDESKIEGSGRNSKMRAEDLTEIRQDADKDQSRESGKKQAQDHYESETSGNATEDESKIEGGGRMSKIRARDLSRIRQDADEDQSKESRKKSARKGEKEEEDKIGSKGGRARSEDEPDSREKSKKSGKQEKTMSSLSITEVERDQQKILVVKSRPTTKKEPSQVSRVGSIEVVTQSQFKLLEKVVNELKNKAGPLPDPSLPDNKALMADLVKGKASLPDTMQAMQLTSRMQAAEKAIGQMAEFLTQLTATGTLPKDLKDKAAILQREVSAFAMKKEVANKEDMPQTKTFASKGVTMTPDTKEAGVPFIAGASVGGASIGGASIGGASSTGAAVGDGASVGGKSVGSKSFARPMPVVDGPKSIGGATKIGKALSAGEVRPVAEPVSKSWSEGTAGYQADRLTYEDLEHLLSNFREEMTKKIKAQTAQVSRDVENVLRLLSHMKANADKVGETNDRITVLTSLVADYKTQVEGLDSGIDTQMQFFYDQMNILIGQLQSGLTVMATFESSESAALSDLKEQFLQLKAEYEETHYKQKLQAYHQNDFGNEFQSLMECLEMTKEEKADRDEVADALMDKADVSRLRGMLSGEDFQEARHELDFRIQMCHEKFRKQDKAWLEALKDLIHVTTDKAPMLDLLSLREEMQKELRELHEKVQILTRIIGEPKAAVLCRKISKDGTCGPCKIPARMDFRDHRHGAPPKLPVARAGPAGAPAPAVTEKICLTPFEYLSEEEPAPNAHVCHRWVGGSHTNLAVGVTRARAPSMISQIMARKRHVGIGSDGKPYQLEQSLLPCTECNVVCNECKCNQSSSEKIPGEADEVLPLEIGAGDQVTVVTPTDARRISIIDEKTIQQAATVDRKPSETHDVCRCSSETHNVCHCSSETHDVCHCSSETHDVCHCSSETHDVCHC